MLETFSSAKSFADEVRLLEPAMRLPAANAVRSILADREVFARESFFPSCPGFRELTGGERRLGSPPHETEAAPQSRATTVSHTSAIFHYNKSSPNSRRRMAAASPSELFPLITSFLEGAGLNKTAKALASETKNWKEVAKVSAFG